MLGAALKPHGVLLLSWWWVVSPVMVPVFGCLFVHFLVLGRFRVTALLRHLSLFQPI